MTWASVQKPEATKTTECEKIHDMGKCAKTRSDKDNRLRQETQLVMKKAKNIKQQRRRRKGKRYTGHIAQFSAHETVIGHRAKSCRD
jgi:hypothetical protein